MTHSQQPSIEILKSGILRFETLSQDYPGTSYYENIVTDLKAMLYNIESLPQSSSVESLLEEMGASMHQMRDGSRDWKAYIQLDNFDTYHEAYGKTPLLALLALKEKLNNNQQ